MSKWKPSCSWWILVQLSITGWIFDLADDVGFGVFFVVFWIFYLFLHLGLTELVSNWSFSCQSVLLWLLSTNLVECSCFACVWFLGTHGFAKVCAFMIDRYLCYIQLKGCDLFFCLCVLVIGIQFFILPGWNLCFGYDLFCTMFWFVEIYEVVGLVVLVQLKLKFCCWICCFFLLGFLEFYILLRSRGIWWCDGGSVAWEVESELVLKMRREQKEGCRASIPTMHGIFLPSLEV